MQPLGHPLVWCQGAVRSLPGQFAAFETAKEAFQAFGFSLFKPFLVLQMVLIIGSLLRLLHLVGNGVEDQVSSMWISEFDPVVAGVHELSPRGWANPVLGCILECCEKAAGLPFFFTLEQCFFSPSLFFPPSKPFFSPSRFLFFPPFGTFFFHPPKTFYFHPAPCHFHPVACFFHPSPCFFHPSPFLFHPRPFLFNPPPVKQVSHGTCTEKDVTSGLFHTACPCTCQILCFHPNSFLLLALRNPPETA